MSIPADKTLISVTISATESVSNAVHLGDVRIGAINMPATWTTAGITLQTSVDGTAWRNVFDGDGEYAIAAAASNWIVVDDALSLGLGPYVRLRSGTVGDPVAQEANRIIGLYVYAR